MGQGKSTENVYSWAGRGLFLAQPGALRVATTVVGYDLGDRVQQCARMEDVPGWIRWAAENGFEAVVVDDASLLMANTQAQSRPMFEKNGGYDFGMYTYWQNAVYDVAYAARWAGIHVILNFHEQAAFTDKKTGESYPAGPDLGWKKLVKILPHTACVVGRIATPPPGAPAWDTRMDCNPRTPGKMMKDRFEVAPPDGGPLNTAEMLRAAGYPVSRPAGLEWMEDVAEKVASMVIGGEDPKSVTSKAKKAMLDAGTHPLHIRWALRDGVHRSRFRAHRAHSVLDGF
jgi:hypothetical protein